MNQKYEEKSLSWKWVEKWTDFVLKWWGFEAKKDAIKELFLAKFF